MRKQIIRLTENDLHRIIENAVIQVIREEGECGGGATTCGSVMQDGGTNPSAGQYDVPFVSDSKTKKRSKDFKNGSMMMQRDTNESTDVISRPIYKIRK